MPLGRQLVQRCRAVQKPVGSSFDGLVTETGRKEFPQTEAEGVLFPQTTCKLKILWSVSPLKKGETRGGSTAPP